jgi:hypothetical protein
MTLTDDELRLLYTAPPDAFVRMRNELVRSLKKDGRRDDADDVAARRRPSVIAWSLNAVVHADAQLVDEWYDAASDLRAAMRRAVRGDAEPVRRAQAAERRATDQVVTAARRHLEEFGSKDSDAVAARLAGTLRAAALDDDVAARLRSGTLETDIVASGFGFELSATDDSVETARPNAVARTRARAPTRTPDTDDRAADRARRAEATRLANAAQRLATAAEKAQRKVDGLRAQAEELQGRLRDAEREARRARNEAERGAAVAERARRG